MTFYIMAVLYLRFVGVPLAIFIGVTGPPRDTLRTTTCSHHTLPTPYNPTLAEYGRSLAEYGRTLRVAADGILPHIAVVGRTWQNMESGARPVLPKAPGVLKYATSQNLTLDEL